MNSARADLATLDAIDDAARSAPRIDVGLAVPSTLLVAADQVARTLSIGAQDIHSADQGAHTGCLSAPMVKDAGASFTLVGHSECRAGRSETDAEILAKAEAAHRHGLRVILCVGEDLEIREAGGAESFVQQQLDQCLPPSAGTEWLAVAYEPIWAIGTGRSATIEDIAAMHAALRRTCQARLGAAEDCVRLLYGGSVTSANAGAILTTLEVDGVVVGGASLTADAFLPIVASA